MADWQRLEELARQVVDGEPGSWQDFMTELEGRLQVMVRRARIGPLRARDDDLRNIAVSVYEKLDKHDQRALRAYFAMPDRPRFANWMGLVVRSCAIDYLRGHAEYRRTATDDDRWVSLATLRTGDGAPAGDSLATKRRRVARDIEEAVAAAAAAESLDGLARRWQIQPVHVRRLARKGELYLQVLELLFEGHSYSEIARRLATSRRDVELACQYIQELLTARYR